MDIAAFDAGLLQATIARALRRGGDFAEVFVEDRDSLGLRLEDGGEQSLAAGDPGVAELQSAAAGVRRGFEIDA